MYLYLINLQANEIKFCIIADLYNFKANTSFP